MAEMTPMKAQYAALKEQYKDCLLFFRLGDFYEMFDEDAILASRELDIALTTRDRGKPEAERTPMCGVPYHSAESYISRLISKGYKVAVCEQKEDPLLAKGLVQRDVIRVVSPGTVLESSMLEESRSNYLAAVFLRRDTGGVAFCDVSTGELCAASFPEEAVMHLSNELARFHPREAVLSEEAASDTELCTLLQRRLGCRLERRREDFSVQGAGERLRAVYGEQSLSELGLREEDEAVLCALGGLLGYLADAQRGDMRQLRRPEIFARGRYMELDAAALRGLELTQNLRSGEKRGSLLWVLDHTGTPMGGRLLRSWVERPLLSPSAITARLDAVEELYRDNVGRGELRSRLRGVGDIQRLLSRAVYGTANGRDMAALGEYLEKLPGLFSALERCRSRHLRAIAATDPLTELGRRLCETVSRDAPLTVREGGIFNTGCFPEVDRLRTLRDNGSQAVLELEARERERTGVKKLRVGYNKVFGYYIDIPNSAGQTQLPEDYIRKQTLVNGERYFTPELKELEESLLSARERLAKLEYELFQELLGHVSAQTDALQTAAQAVARLDACCSLAETAVRNRYVRPEIEASRRLEIREGRHPVVEQMQKDTLFVPNDTVLNDGDDRLAIITGPNMAGKSTYMRQTALIVLMAQMGSFVPARSAHIGVVDRVFTRIGASDDLSAGRSTFMVEMTEVAEILRHATADSLLILDEIGRGTSTYDGMAIARAVLEHCADARRLGARTMFATHYHELSALEGGVPGVRNYNITARKRDGQLIFLRKIVRGAADDSYGIEVAKLAGVPERVVKKAKEYLRELETAGRSSGGPGPAPEPELQLGLADMGGERVLRRLRELYLDGMTPLEALGLLYELKKEAGET